MLTSFLTFSDSAKLAQATLNFIKGQGLSISHSFFSQPTIASFQPGSLFPANTLPLPAWVLSFIFRFFPATDLTIILTGVSFYVISSFLVFLISKKLYSFKVGLLAFILFLLNPFFLNYANNFTSEVVFTFEFLLLTYSLLLPSKQKLISLVPLSLMFFTRQQASVVLVALPIASFPFFIKSQQSKLTKIIISLVITISLLLFLTLSKTDVSSIFSPAKIIGSFHMSTGLPQGSYLRGTAFSGITLSQFISKIFYNTYNFVKSPDRLVSPIIIFLFLISLFSRHKGPSVHWFNSFSLTCFLLLILAASATLPNARYVHPVVPLIIISASATLVQLASLLKTKGSTILITLSIIFITLPTIGNYTLDARARAKQFNIDQPPVYKQIASVMAENIPKGQLIITNLDAWAAWYEGLTTMWFPLEINMLEGYQDKIDYIVITNYKENDGDFALGEWKEVVYNPQDISNEFLKQNYKVLKTFVIQAEESYDNQAYQGTILIRK